MSLSMEEMSGKSDEAVLEAACGWLCPLTALNCRDMAP